MLAEAPGMCMEDTGIEPEFSCLQCLSFELQQLTSARGDNTSSVLPAGWPSSSAEGLWLRLISAFLHYPRQILPCIHGK